jgi:peptidoglycan/LPS O-acetylase OafA/YrhL
MQNRAHLPALTGLRFVAAVQVLLYHTLPHTAPGTPAWVRALVGHGYVGVSLFFVLSGFILAYNYEDAIRARRVTWRAFWWARFARVYPVYLLGLLVALPPFFFGRAFEAAFARVAANVGASVVMLQAWWPRKACQVNCPGWSVSVEAAFYLAFPLLALAAARLSRRGLLRGAGIAWLASLAFPVAYLLLAPDGPAAATTQSQGVWLAALKYHPLARVAEFAVGVAAGSRFLRRGEARTWRWADITAVAAIAAVLAFAGGIPYPLLHNGLLAALFAVLVYALADGGGPVGRLLGGPRWRLPGEASYALYILHVPLGTWVDFAFRSAGAPLPPMLRFALTAALSLACAVLAFRFVEEPARRWLRDLARKRERKQESEMPAPPSLALATETAGAD